MREHNSAEPLGCSKDCQCPDQEGRRLALTCPAPGMARPKGLKSLYICCQCVSDCSTTPGPSACWGGGGAGCCFTLGLASCWARALHLLHGRVLIGCSGTLRVPGEPGQQGLVVRKRASRERFRTQQQVPRSKSSGGISQPSCVVSN